MFLSKSDFKIARTCSTKLYYKKRRYPSLLDDNLYLEFLADGGYMVETMAKLLFPDGKEIGHWEKPEQAFQETSDALAAGNVTLFEATIIHNHLLARVDILRRVGDELRIIEVKSSSMDSEEDAPNPFRGKNGNISSGWIPYLEDVTFQSIVLQRAFPQWQVVPFLCVVDKAKTATADTTFDKFILRRTDDDAGQWRPQVDYIGDAAHLRSDHILVIANVADEAAELRRDVETAAAEFVATVQVEPISRIAPSIGQKCKKCEYRLLDHNTQPNGFHECWGALADPDPHILDLYRVDLVGGKKRDVVAELAEQGHTALSDAPRDLLTGATAARQLLQLDCTAKNREHITPKLKEILSHHPHPLHFIDFEASRLAIPYHVGMRPYEIAAFQWSYHTMPTAGATTQHTEWLNTADAFPNFDFARALKNQIGDNGTVYIWSPYELTVLREIRQQMMKYGHNDRALADWLDVMTADHNPRVVDLCALAKDHYFHPAMKGSLSIKHVLPAVWGENATLRANPAFSKYVKHDEHGVLLDPYKTLPSLPIGEKEEVVQEGTGAMRVYQEMMFGRARTDPALRDNYRQLLLQYCELDTAAMVVIWTHWVDCKQKG